MDGPRNSPICNSLDRISNLPETLIHNILSCMDMTCVVQTCVLSKRWRHLWTCTPVLNFDSHHHPYQKFIKFVDKVFVLRDGSNIQRVSLVCGRQQRNSFDVSTMAASITTWIVAAVRRNVQELYLDTSGVKISRFPQCLFTCNSLIKLELKLGVKSGIIVLPTCVDLPRLTFMKLDSLPSTDVNRLFLKCPVLESLIIEGHLGHMDVQISSWTLKHLRIVDFASKTLSRVKIDAPNLVSLVCRDCISKCYVLENLASLVTADIDMRDTEDEAGKMSEYAENHWLFLVALSNAKEIRLAGLSFHLSLCATGRARGLLADSAKISLQFSNLRVLKVNWYLSGIFFQALGGLLHISPNVESLWIVSLGNLGSHKPDDVDYWAGVSLSSCKLNHLKSVEIRGLLGYYNELKLVEILFKNAVVLKKMVLFSSKESKRNKRLITFGEKLLKLPKASSNVTTFLI